MISHGAHAGHRTDAREILREDADTARLVARFQAGEPDLYAELYARYREPVRAFVLAKLRDPCDADEVTQEVFASARRSLPRYAPHAKTPWRGWLFAIARDCVVDRLRRRVGAELVEPLKLDLLRETAHHDASGWIEDGELLALLDELPEPQRHVLTLRYWLDQSVAETARLLDRHESDVKALQRRALRALRGRLTQTGWAERFGYAEPERIETERLEVFMTGRRGPSPVLHRRRLALALSA